MSKAFPKVREFLRKNGYPVTGIFIRVKQISKLNLDVTEALTDAPLEFYAAFRADIKDLKDKRIAYERKRDRKIQINDSFLDARARYLAANDISLEQFFKPVHHYGR